jgi:hypothetical protein
VTGNPERTKKSKKYYQCALVLAVNEGVTWQPSELSKGSTVVEKDIKKPLLLNIKKTVTNQKLNISYTKCHGTLMSTVSVHPGGGVAFDAARDLDFCRHWDNRWRG